MEITPLLTPFENIITRTLINMLSYIALVVHVGLAFLALGQFRPEHFLTMTIPDSRLILTSVAYILLMLLNIVVGREAIAQLRSFRDVRSQKYRDSVKSNVDRLLLRLPTTS